MTNKYQTLVNILDVLCGEAPVNYKKYRPARSNTEKVNQARSRALIHLYLKVVYGLTDFVEREEYITDQSYDAGIDAYFIDNEKKEIVLIQSKFRTTQSNFQKKNISFDELLCMDVSRVLDGEEDDEEGNAYNSKIKKMQRNISKVPDIGRYRYSVIILANCKNVKSSSMKKLTGGYPARIFDHSLVYENLVFPVVCGTYYSSSELTISLNLSNTSNSASRINYSVNTEFTECDITILFVPTVEIGKILYDFQNSILKFNPRCYLEMQSSSVNSSIYQTVTQKNTNEFALYNNGITMLSDKTSINEQIGLKDTAQVIVQNPQIINGGQTAFTLSRVYEQMIASEFEESIFSDKEVLLKIITIDSSDDIESSEKLTLIESISKATNNQSPVSDADRRSNDKIQIDLQSEIFAEFGLFYERKKGEFANGIKDRYLNRSQIINRDLLLKVAICSKMRPALVKSSLKKLYSTKVFDAYINSESCPTDLVYGYKVHSYLQALSNKARKDEINKYWALQYGYSLRYGIFSVISIAMNSRPGQNAFDSLEDDVDALLEKWPSFEMAIQEIAHNSRYKESIYDDSEDEVSIHFNFQGYYKGNTINSDLMGFFM